MYFYGWFQAILDLITCCLWRTGSLFGHPEKSISLPEIMYRSQRVTTACFYYHLTNPQSASYSFCYSLSPWNLISVQWPNFFLISKTVRRERKCFFELCNNLPFGYIFILIKGKVRHTDMTFTSQILGRTVANVYPKTIHGFCVYHCRRRQCQLSFHSCLW